MLKPNKLVSIFNLINHNQCLQIKFPIVSMTLGVPMSYSTTRPATHGTTLPVTGHVIDCNTRPDTTRPTTQDFRTTIPGFKTTTQDFRTTIPGFRTTTQDFRTTIPGFRTTTQDFRTTIPGWPWSTYYPGWTLPTWDPIGKK